MKAKKTSRYISTALLSSLLLTTAVSVQAQDTAGEEESPKPTKYIPEEDEKVEPVFFQGFTLSADIFGIGQYLLSDYGSIEAALRLNLKNTYFPIAELGYGICDVTNYNTNISYKTNAPYLRIGCDINFLKNKMQDNRLYVGVRYGISPFKYDMAGPDMTDPVWGGNRPFNYSGISSTAHWGELVFAFQVKIWSNFHMGWSIRMKKYFSISYSKNSQPYYIPGYGTTTNSTAWGGTYNLIFDLNWGKKKKSKATPPPELIKTDAANAETDTTTPKEEETKKAESADDKSAEKVAPENNTEVTNKKANND